MTSLEKAVAKLGLDEWTPNADGFILPFCKKKEVVLSKLPEDFQDQFRKYDSLRVSASNGYEMYNSSWELPSSSSLLNDEDKPAYNSYQSLQQNSCANWLDHS